MSLQVEIQKKPNKTDYRKITKPEDVYNLEEVQEIKDALQEHFLFIGLYGLFLRILYAADRE